MALKSWLDSIKNNFSPEDGQIIVRSMQQDPLVWQFIKDGDKSLAFIDTNPSELIDFSPGRLAVWLIENQTGISLPVQNEIGTTLPDGLKTQGSQALQTTLRTGLPPADLFTAGLLALTLLERRKRKNSWHGITGDLFPSQNLEANLKYVNIWKTPISCLFSLASDFDDLAAEFFVSSEKNISCLIPIYLHSFLSNPIAADQLFNRVHAAVKTLPMDNQLESLNWLNRYKQKNLQVQLAKHLMQSKDNRDFFARIFSEFETFTANSPGIDPIEKRIRYDLPEDLNRLAAFHFFSGDKQRANDAYQNSSDVLELLKAQTTIQSLLGESGHIPAIRWLDIIKSVPHSKQLRLWYAKSLVEEQKYEEAKPLLVDSPASFEKQVLLSQIGQDDQPLLKSLKESNLSQTFNNKSISRNEKSYYVHPVKTNYELEMIKFVERNPSEKTANEWLEDYINKNTSDIPALTIARDIYENTDLVHKALETTAYLESLEPFNPIHKRDLARLHAKSGNWKSAYDLLQELVISENTPPVSDLENFAEAALTIDQLDVSMTVCQNIIHREPNNPKALVLLGEVFLAKGDFVKAIQHMENVVTTIPTVMDAWMTLAGLWQKSGQFERAIETLKKGIQFVVNKPELFRALGNAHFQYENYTDAVTAFYQAHSMDPGHLPGKLALAQTHLKLNEGEKSFSLLEPFVVDYEQHPEAARLLGQTLLALGKHDQARPVLIYAASQIPGDLTTVIPATQLFLDQFESDPEMMDAPRELDTIKTTLENAVSIHSENVHLTRHLADIDRLEGHYQKAFDTYNHLIKTCDDEKLVDWRLHFGLGQAAIKLGDKEVALAALQSALNQQPTSLMVRHAIADALLISALPEKATSMAKSALRMAPQDLSNILWYARFNTNNNQPDEAVRALKEAIQITPNRNELKLWLANSLVDEGSLEEAHDVVQEFISTDELSPELHHKAAYTCIHLNDLPLAKESLNKVLQRSSSFKPIWLMDFAVVHNLMGDNKKAIEILNVEQAKLDLYPEIALLKSTFLCNLGQYENAHIALEAVKSKVDQLPEGRNGHNGYQNHSPLLYTHNLTQTGFYTRLGQIERVTGHFDNADAWFKTAAQIDPDSIKIFKNQIDTAMANLEFRTAVKISEDYFKKHPIQDQADQDHFDLFFSYIETLMYLEDYSQATENLLKLSVSGESSPRLLAIQSRIAARGGKTASAKDLLAKAITQFQKNMSNLRTNNLPVTFRKIMNLISIGEACLAVDDHRQALQTFQQAYKNIDTQPLVNWRYLHTIISAAESQQIAKTLGIIVNCPGPDCLSTESNKIAEKLYLQLHDKLPQEQLVCLRARMVSAFTGKWPLNLNIDACLQGAEQAAAVLLGCDDANLVEDILDAYPDDACVLQVSGIYALRHGKQNGSSFVEKALSIDTTNPINYAILAQLKINTPDQALKLIETALSFWPEEPAWHALAADLNTQLGNAKPAEEHIKHALEQQPTNADFWLKSALLNISSDDFDRAMCDLENCTTLEPNNPAAWAKKADVNRRMGNYPEAVKNIRKACALAPEDHLFASQEMQFLFEHKSYVELESKAKAILVESKTNETAQIYLAKALAKQGKFEQALATLQTAIQDDPDQTSLILERLKIKKDQSGIDAVLPELVSLAETHAQDSEILMTLTDWLILSKRLDQAEEVALTTVKVLPDQAEIYVMLGRLQRIKGKLDQAVAHLSQAITLNPTLVDAYIELGKTYQERRDIEKAIEIFQKGSKANQSDPRPYFHAGMALKESKDYPGAELMFKEAKKHAPDDANIIRQLGVVTALNLINNLREAN